MISAPNESEDERRVASLRALEILDTPPDDRFDRLTRLARRLFDVPISLISLVDENRQWFKSRDGLDVAETSREVSFCDHAIRGNDVFEVNDTALDARFKDNPLVTGYPEIRFYAGSPIRAMNGYALGTLCIIDHKPRKLSNEEREMLRDLALIAERELLALQLTTHDDLTGLLNRRGFNMLAGKWLTYSRRNDRQAALTFFDLDKFKLINDNYGHAEGDKALVVFARKLQETFRESDIVGRIGGDEFLVLAPDVDKSEADKLVLRLGETLCEHNKGSGSPYKLSFSCGVVEYNRFKHTLIEDLVAEGDQRMYNDKQERYKTGGRSSK